MTRMKQTMITALALGLTLMANPGWAKNPVPKTVAEAKEEMETSSRRPSYRTPPGNVRAEDYRALFGGTVMVAHAGKQKPASKYLNHVKVIFIGRDGRYVWCQLGKKIPGAHADHKWTPRKIRRGKRVYPLLVNGPDDSRLSPLYDAKTGEAIWYTQWRGRWWDWDIGHLQERLPASTWELCPDFPSAEELGVGINKKQTALTYDKLLEQDPGRRILRPDLVTPDVIEVRE